jgi:polyphosphate kinase
MIEKNFKVFSLNESILDLMKNIFKNPKKLEEKLTKVILDIKDDVLVNKKLKKPDIKRILDNFEKMLDQDAIYEMNLDSFVRGLHNLTINPKITEARIEKYIDAYIKTLPKRIKMYFADKSHQFEDDEEFDELKKLKSERLLKIGKKDFLNELRPLQIELLRLQEWIKTSKTKLVILFEGRDAAGKGSAIKSITEFLDPKYCHVATFGIPTEKEKENWFGRYEEVLPEPGNMTLFDRSWYNRAVNDPVMGYCSEEEYRKFIKDVTKFENNLIEEGYILLKMWFSIDSDTQKLRFKMRQNNPLKYWKFSPNDEKTMTKWDLFTKYKEQMFQKTSTRKAPWVVVDSNEKRIAKLNVIRYILNKVPYEPKETTFDVYPEVIVEIL